MLQVVDAWKGALTKRVVLLVVERLAADCRVQSIGRLQGSLAMDHSHPILNSKAHFVLTQMKRALTDTYTMR